MQTLQCLDFTSFYRQSDSKIHFDETFRNSIHHPVRTWSESAIGIFRVFPTYKTKYFIFIEIV